MLPVPLRYSCSPQMMLCPPDAWRPANSTATRTAGLGASPPLTLPLLLPLALPFMLPFTEFTAGGEVLEATCVLAERSKITDNGEHEGELKRKETLAKGLMASHAAPAHTTWRSFGAR